MMHLHMGYSPARAKRAAGELRAGAGAPKARIVPRINWYNSCSAAIMPQARSARWDNGPSGRESALPTHLPGHKPGIIAALRLLYHILSFPAYRDTSSYVVWCCIFVD